MLLVVWSGVDVLGELSPGGEPLEGVHSGAGAVLRRGLRAVPLGTSLREEAGEWGGGAGTKNSVKWEGCLE